MTVIWLMARKWVILFIMLSYFFARPTFSDFWSLKELESRYFWTHCVEPIIQQLSFVASCSNYESLSIPLNFSDFRNKYDWRTAFWTPGYYWNEINLTCTGSSLSVHQWNLYGNSTRHISCSQHFQPMDRTDFPIWSIVLVIDPFLQNICRPFELLSQLSTKTNIETAFFTLLTGSREL